MFIGRQPSLLQVLRPPLTNICSTFSQGNLPYLKIGILNKSVQMIQVPCIFPHSGLTLIHGYKLVLVMFVLLPVLTALYMKWHASGPPDYTYLLGTHYSDIEVLDS